MSVKWWLRLCAGSAVTMVTCIGTIAAMSGRQPVSPETPVELAAWIAFAAITLLSPVAVIVTWFGAAIEDVYGGRR